MDENPEKRLWVPGQELEYGPYTEEHLIKDWATLYNKEDPRPLVHIEGDILGVVHLPESTPTKVASVDLCDVLRETHLASALAMGKEREDIGSDVWIYTTMGLERNVMPEVVKSVMNADLVEPVEDIEEIREIMQDWQAQDTYIVANTSTLPNCERATIENFLARYLPNCFDGIVLPRNHYGNEQVTKGDALQAVVATIMQQQEPPKVEKAVHIDDAPYHINDVDCILGEVAIEGVAIMPTYAPGALSRPTEPAKTNPGIVKAIGPLDAFRKADQFFFG